MWRTRTSPAPGVADLDLDELHLLGAAERGDLDGLGHVGLLCGL